MQAWALRAIVGAFVVLVVVACDRVGAATRPLRVRGIPLCPHGVTYARPIVLRVDRDRALFEEAYSTQKTLDAPPPAHEATIDVARTRMKVTVRVGICAATSLATWDCNAASWVGSGVLALDAKSTPAEVTLEVKDVPCADGSLAK